MEQTNTLLQSNIIANEELNDSEINFLSSYFGSFIENNNSFLNFDLNEEDNFNEYLKLKDNEIDFPTKKIEHIEDAAGLFIDYLKQKKRIIGIMDSDLDGSCCRGVFNAIDLFLKRTYKYDYVYEHYFAIGHAHGICFEQIDTLLEGDVDSDTLIITADNGINNRREILKIQEKYTKVKIIITDHHLADENEQVFDIVDYVINPEAIGLNQKSEITKVIFNSKEVKTSFSGAHTFYFFMKEVLEQLKIKDENLDREILLIALFSDIGDIINFGPDVLSLFTKNIQHFNNIFFIEKYQKNLDSFNQFPEEHFDFKVNEYISKVITILNSTRRTNSILLKFNSLSKEEFCDWIKDKFTFDNEVDFIVLNKKTKEQVKLYDLLTDLNMSAKKIYNHFSENWKFKTSLEDSKKFNYSYIKEMVVFLLLSNDSNKTKNDSYFLDEAYQIITKMNLIKNGLRAFIVENELYISEKHELFETYFSKRDGVLREILSIQAFIESDGRKSFLTLAQNNPKVINGSLRSKSIDFKHLFNEDPEVQELKKAHGFKIEIFGHTAAAGIFFKKETEFSYDDLSLFLDEFSTILKNRDVKIVEKKKTHIDLVSLANIDFNKMISIIKNKIVIGPNSFLKPFVINFSSKDLTKIFGNRLVIKKAASGTNYMNMRDNNGNTFLFFPNDDFLGFDHDYDFECTVNIKYNSQRRTYFCELMMNSL